MRYSQRAIPIIGLMLAMLFWGSSFVAMKIAFRDYELLHVIFWRLAIATCCFALILGFTILGERFTTQQLLAALLVFSGVVISQWGGRTAALERS